MTEIKKGKSAGEKNGMYGIKRPDVSARNKIPKRWITNGIIDKLVDQRLVDEYFLIGFVIGRSNFK